MTEADCLDRSIYKIWIVYIVYYEFKQRKIVIQKRFIWEYINATSFYFHNYSIQTYIH